MKLPWGSFFGNWWRRFLSENPPFYPAYANFFMNNKMPVYIDMENLMIVYLSVPHLRAVIDRKAEMFKNMQIKLRNKKTGEFIEQHEILTLLKNPNPMQTQEQFLEQYCIFKDIWANAFIYKLRATSMSSPKVLWNLPSDAMKITPTGKIWNQTKLEEIIEKYEMVSGNLQPIKFEVNEIIQISQGASQNYFVGESRIKTLVRPISNIQGALQTRNVIINDRGALGILSGSSKDSDGAIPLGKDERERIEKEYRDKQRGYGIGDEQKKVIISPTPLAWSPMSYPTKDLMLFEEIEEDFGTICAEFGMERDLFPTVKGATFENKNQAIKSTYQNTIQPEADLFMRKLSKDFGLEDAGFELVADYSYLPVMQEDKLKEEQTEMTKAQKLGILLDKGIISKEQFAQLMGVEFDGNEEEKEESVEAGASPGN